MSQRLECLYEFGPFRIDAVKRVLLREGEIVPLTSKSLDTLLVLVEHSGQVVTKDDLMKTLWPDTVVEENNLTQQISMLRKALGERANEHRYVVTVPGRGYSFVAEVSGPRKPDMNLVVEQHIRSRITVGVEDSDESELLIPKYLPGSHLALPHRWGSKSTMLLLFAGLAGLALLLGFWFSSPGQVAQKGERKRSIAVLPFKPLNSDSNNDYLSTGMADALIAKLSNIRQISVRPTSAIIKYAGQTQEAQAIGRELGVDSVLEGTVQRVSERVRVTVQLVSVEERDPAWAKSFDEGISDIFALQDTISEQVAQTMMVKLNGEEQRQLRKRETENVEAYQEYLRGRYFWNKRDQDGLKKSLDYFQHAVDLDPNYGQAYAGLADAYTLFATYRIDSFSPDEAFRRARAAATKALAIDESQAEAHASLAMIKVWCDHDGTGAEAEFKRAIALNPNYATAHHWYSEYLARSGRETEAMTEIGLAQELDPLSPVINTTLGERLYYARRYDEAIAQSRRTLEVAPDFESAHFVLGLALEQKGRFEEAISELQKAKGTASVNMSAAASLAHTYALAGHGDKARKILHDLLAEKMSEPYEIAVVYQGLGEKPQAISWLKKVVDGGELRMLLKLDPRLDSLRSEPRFQELLAPAIST
jgi:TolB-like protein/DNA-binding winged helix-turn-helix (wHTH) protein/Flp pilus assembly protein TadD